MESLRVIRNEEQPAVVTKDRLQFFRKSHLLRDPEEILSVVAQPLLKHADVLRRPFLRWLPRDIAQETAPHSRQSSGARDHGIRRCMRDVCIGWPDAWPSGTALGKRDPG